MKEIATIRFVDVETEDDGAAIVRSEFGCVGLCLTLMQNGDIEVFLNPSDAEQLSSALNQAIEIAIGKT